MIISLKNGLNILNMDIEWFDELCYDIINEQDPIVVGNEVEYTIDYDPNTPNLGMKLIEYCSEHDLFEEISLECNDLNELENYLTSIIQDHYTQWCDHQDIYPQWYQDLQEKSDKNMDICDCEDYPCCGHIRP